MVKQSQPIVRLRFLLCATIFGAIFILSILPQSAKRVQAQEPVCITGTLPGTIPDGVRCLFLPAISAPLTVFDAIPVMGSPIDRPAALNGDVNLALRSYITTTALLELIDINGPTDTHAPQLSGLFTPTRLPIFPAAYQVHNWDWSCGDNGCRADPIAQPPVTLLAMQATLGEPIFIPSRTPEIYGGGYRALVLYAEEERITLTYTREDTPAIGYLIHLEDLRVDPGLLLLYRQLDAAGRSQLPALRNGERLGNALARPLKVAIRDTGSFMDPRSRKDWWATFYVE